MTGRDKPKYYLVEAGVLPEVFTKVTEARELLETGEVRTVADAVERVGISRSAFYKYKDSVMPFRDMRQGSIVTFNALLRDKKRMADTMNFILVHPLGKAVIHKIPLEQLRQLILSL